ncbi:MAG: phytoene/squalene synthase family protein [Hylemonella sp.]|uniref:phytoene/squalene synthase family protein n=1 Tax=Hylemonella sp. TaxID=2066020 RepID=UPI0022CB8D5C|nr:phytoene/squalene synthase family protein [Hylemonella sp.]MCZ8253808.1 phytoene/squalene synthase family protein [Hylemonella sp.]
MPDTALGPDSLQACATMMQGGSKTFFAASRLLPLRIRQAAIALYAFCRVADDLVDEAAPGDAPVDVLRERLDLIYAGTPSDFVEDHALSTVVQQYQLPRHLLDALIEGFAWDAAGRSYDSLEDVQAYAARVAGSVGAMMCWIMGPQSVDTLARACELGVAMQLTNIARDVGADAAIQRIYLPRDWLREAGITPDTWLQQPVCTPALQSVITRLLDEADRLYQQAQTGIAALPPDCRAAILSASLIYAEIGHQLRRDGLDPVTHRTVVSTARKLVLLAAAWAQAPWIRTPLVAPTPLAAIDYLVRDCQQPRVSSELAGAFFPNRAMPQRVAWVMDLLERREDARRLRRQPMMHSRSA